MEWHIKYGRDIKEIQNYLNKLSSAGVTPDRIKLVSTNENYIDVWYLNDKYILV